MEPDGFEQWRKAKVPVLSTEIQTLHIQHALADFAYEIPLDDWPFLKSTMNGELTDIS
jgi:hypothetical protein